MGACGLAFSGRFAMLVGGVWLSSMSSAVPSAITGHDLVARLSDLSAIGLV